MDNQHVASRTSSANSTNTARNKIRTRSSNRRSINRTKGTSCKQQASQHQLKQEASFNDEIQMASLASRRTSVESPRVSMQSDRISFKDDRASNNDGRSSRHRLDAWNSNQESFSRNELTVSRNFSSPTGAYTPNQSRYFDSRRNTFDRTSAIYTKGVDYIYKDVQEDLDEASSYSRRQNWTRQRSEQNKPHKPNEEGHSYTHNSGAGNERNASDHNNLNKSLNKQPAVGQPEPNQPILFNGYVPVALKYLTQNKQPRHLCLNLITSPWFERISMFIILINCITLGMYQPCEDNPCVSTKCIVLKYVDHLIYSFFVIEMTIKIIAMGFWGENTYMAETWNRLDFFIVVAGTLEYAIASENLSLTSIRTVRVLRPLRAINRVPSMRILVMLLLDTLPMLGNVFLLCFFVFFIFGIIGVQLWKGVLRNRCYFDYNVSTMGDLLDESFRSTYYTPVFTDSFICSEAGTGGMTTCADIPAYMNNSRVCNGTIEMLRNVSMFANESECVNWNSYFTKCRPSDKNPFKGSISFDNIGYAWVAIFQIISLESWVTIMYFIQDAHSFWDWIYFVFLIVIGSFFMINLCLVVIATQFSETKRRETERMIAERKRFSPTSSTILSEFGQNEPGSCWDELLNLAGHMLKKAKRKLVNQYTKMRGKEAVETRLKLTSKAMNRRRHLKNSVRLKLKVYRYHVANHQMICRENNNSSARTGGAKNNSFQLNNTFNSSTGVDLGATTLSTEQETIQCSNNFLAAPMSDNSFKKRPKVQLQHSFDIDDQTFESININTASDANRPEIQLTDSVRVKCERILADCDHCKAFMSSLVSQLSIEASGNEDNTTPYLETTTSAQQQQMHEQSTWFVRLLCCCCHQHYTNSRFYKFCTRSRRRLREFVESWMFQRAILIAILINTLSMGVEHHDQPALLTSVVEISNIVFSTIFLIEMIFKVTAFGLFGYIRDGYNLFDGCIVLISVYEVFTVKPDEIKGQSTSGQSISVLRTFRLLRILKLIRFMPALRRQLVVMLKTMDNVATFFSLLILFIFIFSILGMNLFGCKFCSKQSDGIQRCERKNFDSLLWATITVFQVLTQEDWNEVLYSGMDRTSSWAALYFIALMTFGNYVLFNLLVAILVEGFSTEDEPRKPLTDRIIEDALNAIKEEARSRDASNYDDSRNESRMLEAHDGVTPTSRRSIKSRRSVRSQIENQESFSSTANDIAYEFQVLPSRPTNLLSADNSQRESFKSFPTPIITQTCPTPVLRQRSLCTSIKKKMPIQHCRNLSIDSAFNLVKSTNFNKKIITRSISSRIYDSHSSAKRHAISNIESISIPNLHPQSSQLTQQKLFLLENTQLQQQNVHHYNRHSSLSKSAAEMQCQSSVKYLSATKAAMSSHTRSRSEKTSRKRDIKLDRQPTGPFIVPPDIIISEPSTFEFNDELGVSSMGSSEKSLTNKSIAIEADIIGDKVENGKISLVQSSPSRMEFTPRERKFDWCFDYQEAERRQASLYLFSRENLFRRLCIWITSKKSFDYTILLFIALNCITLAMERPNIPEESLERKLLTNSNYIFTILFAIEMLLKVIAAGLYLDEKAYLRSGWNIMDACLVVVSTVDIALSFTAQASPKIFGILRVFRLLRTLRPLRVISRAPGLKLVVQTLLSSLRPIGNIVLICCTFFIIFGILGVQLFKGKFYYCVGEDIDDVKTKRECLANPRNQWLNTQYNFDNLGKALMALFVLSSKDGWVQIMYTGIDAVGVDMQPQENHNEWMLLYFISFLLLVGFFVLNMFVGVVIENFHKCRAEQEREEKAMRAAKRAKKIEEKRKTFREIPYYATYSRPRLILHSICNSKYFDLIIAAVIGLNVVSMSLEFYLMPDVLDEILDYLNFMFTIVFLIEAILRIIALGFTRYIKDRWNQLDIIIVILSIIGIFFDKLKSRGGLPVNPTIIRVMRVLRIARVLKLLKMAKGIRSLLDTVIQALPQVGNLALLFFLLFFIFATLGVELFGRLNCESHKSACEGLSKHAHFHNFGMAFLTLFRIATGDNWNGIMKDTLKNNILCNEEPNPDGSLNNSTCLASMLAPIYFVVFVLMAQFVLVNVVVAVLMKHLDESKEMVRDDADIDEEIEIQMEKERIRMEQSERQAKIDKVNKETHSKIKRKYTSLPSNFNYDMLSNKDAPTTVIIRTAVDFYSTIFLTLQAYTVSIYLFFNINIPFEEPSISVYESTHSINVPNQRKLSTNSCQGAALDKEPDLPQDMTLTNLNNMSQQSPTIDTTSSIDNSESNRTLDFVSTSSCVSKAQQPPRAPDIRKRVKKLQQDKKQQPRHSLLRHSISSYKSHFSPQPSIRIKIIDETDTDNDPFG